MQIQSKQLPELIGLKGSITREITIVDAQEYETGVSIRVSDNMGEEYWTSLEDVDLDR
jgi:hypothetical protein